LRELLGPERASDEELRTLAARCGHLPLALHAAGAYLTRKRNLRVATYLDALARERGRLAAFKIKGLPSLDVATVLGFSIRHLREDDATLAQRWRQLAVFPTSFDVKAAAALWRADEIEAEIGLQELLARSMVRLERTTGRYSLHDLMRDLAHVPLEAEDQAALNERLDVAAARHAQHYYRVLATAHELYLKGGENVVAGLALYDIEQRNIAAGQAWAVERIEVSDDAAQLAAEYADAGYYVLSLRLTPRAQIGWLKAQLKACRRLGDRRGEAAALGNLGHAYRDLGQPRRAIEQFARVLRIAREIGDRRYEGNALGGLGNAHYSLGEPRRAIGHYEQSLEIAREIGDRRGEGSALGNLGLAYAALGEPQRAIEHYEQVRAIMREIGDRRGEGWALGTLGTAYHDLGEMRRAIDHFGQHLAIAREIGDRRGEGNALGNLGNVYRTLSETRRAIEHHKQHLAIAREIGDRQGEGNALGNLGNAYADLGEPQRLIEHHEQSLQIARGIGDRRGEGRALYNSALAFDQLGERDEAIRRMREALTIYEQIEDPSRQDAQAKLAEWRGEGGG
jgi:tetratricopeptide (TPR) repeat protein